MNDTNTLENIEKRLSAILALMIEERERKSNNQDKEKIEVILKRLGLSTNEIAVLLQKNPGAVKKSLQRAKK